MVRTIANSSTRKAVAAKAPRKQVGGSTSGGSSSSSASASPNSGKNKYAGGNAVMMRPTPQWQKGIGQFFTSPVDNGDISAGEQSSNPEASASDTQPSTSTDNQ